MLPGMHINKYGRRSAPTGLAAVVRPWLFAIAILLTFTWPVGGLVQAAAAQAADAADPWADLRFIIEHLEENFYREIDRSALAQGALQGALQALDDPYTRYLDEQELASMEESIDGSFVGIGVVISHQDDEIVVMSPMSGTPAEKAGIQPGDVIEAVDGQAVRGLSLEEVGGRIRGEAGTQVTLTIRRDSGPPKEFVLTRQRVRLETIEHELLSGGIGYIRIIEFRKRSAREVADAYEDLVNQGAQYFVLDLRNNPGGLLSEAVATAEVFLPDGPITHVAMGHGEEVTFKAKGGGGGLPVAVLINNGSASASEIVAAAIAENEVGFLVGGKSYGKATVQAIKSLDSGGAVQFTAGQYLTPLRHTIAGHGLEPHILVAAASPRQRPEMAPLTGQWVLQVGQRGLEVQGLQERLAWLGYNVGGADGIYGPLTADAVRALQADHQLRATGVFDAPAYAALVEALETHTRAVVPQASLADPVVARAVKALQEGFQPPKP